MRAASLKCKRSIIQKTFVRPFPRYRKKSLIKSCGGQALDTMIFTTSTRFYTFRNFVRERLAACGDLLYNPRGEGYKFRSAIYTRANPSIAKCKVILYYVMDGRRSMTFVVICSASTNRVWTSIYQARHWPRKKFVLLISRQK